MNYSRKQSPRWSCHSKQPGVFLLGQHQRVDLVNALALTFLYVLSRDLYVIKMIMDTPPKIKIKPCLGEVADGDEKTRYLPDGYAIPERAGLYILPYRQYEDGEQGGGRFTAVCCIYKMILFHSLCQHSLSHEIIVFVGACRSQ